MYTMVLSIVEPVFAGLLVSLLNKYLLSGQCTGWLQRVCESSQEIIEESEGEKEGEEAEGGSYASTVTTTISDATVHVHCHG